MNLSFRTVADLKDLCDLVDPFGDLTALARLGNRECPSVTRESLSLFFKDVGRLAIACDSQRIVGSVQMTFEVRKGIVRANIGCVVKHASYAGQGVRAKLIFRLLWEAKHVCRAHEAYILSSPGLIRIVDLKQETGSL